MINFNQVVVSKMFVTFLILIGAMPSTLLANGPYYYASVQDQGYAQYGYDQYRNESREFGQWQNLQSNRSQAPAVVINQKRLSGNEVRTLTAAVGTGIQPGEYWYDQRSGAWGYWCGPTAGFIQAGMKVGGQLSKRASCGQTGVFINGREIHTRDYIQLVNLLGPINPGRYWVDANGNAGYEGGAAMVNLRQVAAQQQKSDGVYRYKSNSANGLFSSGCSGMTVKQPNGSSASAYVGC